MTEPYYSDDLVTLYHGDCREITEWLTADVLVTDPPYGRNWRQGTLRGHESPNDGRGIVGDDGTAARDDALAAWLGTYGIVFGDLMMPPPTPCKLVGCYQKPINAGLRGAIGGVRRDLEAVYFVGLWSTGIGGRSSLFTTRLPITGGANGLSARAGHPHAKPLDLMCELIDLTPEWCPVADLFAGSGSTLVAAKMLGRRAIGVEIDERYCEIAAQRLLQDALPFEEPAS